MLGTECFIGTQKRVGRPRKWAVLGSSEGTTKSRQRPHPLLKDRSIHSNSLSPEHTEFESYSSGQMIPWSRPPIASFPYGTLETNRDTAAFASTPSFVQPGYASMDPLAWEDAFPLFSDMPYQESGPNLESLYGLRHNMNSNMPHQQQLMIMLPTPDDYIYDFGDVKIEAEISRLYADLQLRGAIMESHAHALDLDAIIYRDSPLYIDSCTMAVFTIKTSRTFLQILGRVHRQLSLDSGISEHQTSPRLHRPSDFRRKQLSPPLAAGITSVFGRLLSIYELTVDRITQRLERFHSYPPASMPGVTSEEGVVIEACAQGARFGHEIGNLLAQMEVALGISEQQGKNSTGVLSSEYIKMLWEVLDESTGVAPGRGIMRPTDVRRLLGHVVAILEQLALQQADRTARRVG